MQELVNKLICLNYTIAAAESCTGGMFASRIVDIADASKVLKASFVTYAVEAKEKYAHVNLETVKEYGVVSEEVAGEMAKGVAKEANAQVGVGITGYAGPGEKAGLVCFGIYYKKLYTFRRTFGGSRNEVRKKAVDFIVNELLNLL